MEMPTLADAVKEIEYLRSSLQNPDQDIELKRNILAHLIHQIKIPPRGHGELQYYDPQQHLPLLLAKKADGLVNSISPGRSGMDGDPEGGHLERPPDRQAGEAQAEQGMPAMWVRTSHSGKIPDRRGAVRSVGF